MLILRVVNASLLVFLFGFLFQYLLATIETEKLFVFAYQKNTLQDDLSNTFVNDSKYLKGDIIIDHYKLFVDIALTDKQKQNGLSIKNSMNENEGMLFFLDDPRKASFWMKNMHFPIDIIWLDENLTIVQYRKSTPAMYIAILLSQLHPTQRIIVCFRNNIRIFKQTQY